MESLFISYGIKEYDGRLQELIDVMNLTSKNYKIVCRSINKKNSDNVKSIYFKKSKWQYLKFLFKVFFTALKMKKIDILFIDNYHACFMGWLIIKLKKPKFIIQDVREFYDIKDIKFQAKFFFKYEAKCYKKSDIVMAANEERADLMVEKYNLSKRPYVFENIREFNLIVKKEYEEKYANLFTYNCNVICTGGVSVERGTLDLVSAFKKLGTDYGLYIFGPCCDDKKTINFIKENDITNVHLVGRVSLEELAFVCSKCDIGVVHYHKNDLNNIYCASGKVYEYISLGKPIITSENISLKNFCEKYNVGIADDSYYKGIEEIRNNYEFFQQNAIATSKIFTRDNNNMNMAKIIIEEYNNKTSSDK